MDEREDPRARLGAVGAEGRRAPPHCEEPLLHRILGQAIVAHHALREAECDPAHPVVQLAERGLVPPGDERDERFVREVGVLLAHRESRLGGQR